MGKRILESGLYHVYNRGYNQQKIFYEPRDYQKFIRNLTKYGKEFPRLSVFAFCLLPNHFHFLLGDGSFCTTSSDDNVSKISSFMHRVQGAYAMFFNAKYGEKIKKGLKMPVYEGRFQSKMITNDIYMEQIKIYIEWNAVKHKIVDYPKKWVYSSYSPEESKDNKLERLEDKFNPVFD